MNKRFASQIRFKLFISILSIVLLSGVLSTFIGIRTIQKHVVGQAFDTVLKDLDTADFIYTSRVALKSKMLKHISLLEYIQIAILHNDRAVLRSKCKEIQQELGIDIVNITDAQGKIIVRANNDSYGDDVSDDNQVSYVLKNKIPCEGTDVVLYKHLEREGESIASKAIIKIIPTPKSRKVQRTIIKDALTISVAIPIFHNNNFIGIIYGIRILNNYNGIVDQIKQLVFKEEKLGGLDVGTSTIFLDDVRVCTNVKKPDGTRAIGTLLSEEVYNKVILQGKLWWDKAFVVNNWYISAYKPLLNIYGKPVGILYVGILEKKFDEIKKSSTLNFAFTTALIAIIAVGISLYLLNIIIRPVRTLVKASESVINGNYDTHIEIETEDEIGYLCYTFNQMIDAIKERDKKLKEQTQDQILQSEKLASLGRLASGIAHEINNPLTAILTYSSLLLEDLKETDFEEDLRVIIKETLRCRDIVRNILDFARSTKPDIKRTNVNNLINEVLLILEKHVNFHNIAINKYLDPDVPDMFIDENQFKSVINNLAMNAADAMPQGGTLTVQTKYNFGNDSISIIVSDTGVGIKEEHLDKIFDPFFTTKEQGKGTGLGLAVTYGIIKRYHGNINVHSEVGKGTVFTITFPLLKNKEEYSEYDKSK
ncbi:MAG TPA: cache domain-containing protein [Spirochaetota bacterium]|nr:cache domain-containing protein [Spirochaetota bacterium]HOT18767.1 cache domain-containing protein [Spirochaetota bacterium]HPD04260.1 cache domain-containing protein [Spirochaetota bacterium]HQG41461.1 cache domain-containing protein [Spirochaetota bacterium]HQI37504.1 cache domain-containing protein [Spirochaetota bacterium]